MLRTVNATKLHARPFAHTSFTSKKATLFPFFDRAQDVKLVLVVDAHDSTLRVFRPGSADLSIGTRGIRLRHAGLHRLGPSMLERAGRLLHFDPWWLLADDRFTDGRTIAILKATNCVDRLPIESPVVTYGADLRRVARVTDEKGTETVDLELIGAG